MKTDYFVAAKRVLTLYPQLKLVILYGSAITGRLTENSDIDIAIAAEQPIAREDLADINLKLSKEFGREVDTVDLHRIDGILLREILQTGRVVLNDPELYGFLIKKSLFFESDMLKNITYIMETRARRIAREV